MDVIVCYKLSPDAEDIEVRPDRTISLEKSEWRIGQYDLQAIEAGMQCAEAAGGKVAALSVGPGELESSKAKKAVLSRGPHELFLVIDEALRDADAHQTAQALAAAIRKMGSYDLVLCGEGSADLYAQQVGCQLGQLLGVPTLNGISKIEAGTGKVRVERSLEDEIEVLEVPLPAVLSVTTDISVPRIPGMKEILAAGKKPVAAWSLASLDLADVGSRAAEILSTLSPRQVERKRVILEGESEEIVRQFLEYLAKEAVV